MILSKWTDCEQEVIRILVFCSSTLNIDQRLITGKWLRNDYAFCHETWQWTIVQMRIVHVLLISWSELSSAGYYGYQNCHRTVISRFEYETNICIKTRQSVFKTESILAGMFVLLNYYGVLFYTALQCYIVLFFSHLTLKDINTCISGAQYGWLNGADVLMA